VLIIVNDIIIITGVRYVARRQLKPSNRRLVVCIAWENADSGGFSAIELNTMLPFQYHLIILIFRFSRGSSSGPQYGSAD
jgi:hypothetical protein